MPKKTPAAAAPRVLQRLAPSRYPPERWRIAGLPTSMRPRFQTFYKLVDERFLYLWRQLIRQHRARSIDGELRRQCLQLLPRGAFRRGNLGTRGDGNLLFVALRCGHQALNLRIAFP